MPDRSLPESSEFFALTGKIKALRRTAAWSAQALSHEAELRALVAAWPWLKGLPGLLLADEPIHWILDGGARADLMGVSARGRVVAAELALDPFAQRKAALRSVARGLHRLVSQTQQVSEQSVYAVDAEAPLVGIIVGDGAVFPRDAKQLKTLAKDFRHYCEVQQPSWPVEKHGGGKDDRVTPAWLIDNAQRIELHAVGVARHVDSGTVVIRVTRHKLI